MACTTTAVPSAMEVPSRTPPIESDSQCAARYVRDRPMASENATAAAPHQYRLGPSGNRAITMATTVAEAARACPDGNDPPLTSTSEAGGRGRSYRLFSV